MDDDGPPRPPAALLLDMDGVLVDTGDRWHALERDLLAEAVPGAVDHDAVRGMNYRETYDYLAERHDLRLGREPFLARYEEAAAAVYDEATLLPGVRDLLADCRAAGVPAAVASAARRDWIERVVERFDLALDAVVGVDDVPGPGKPAPDIYEAAAARVGAAPERAVAVEDSPNGLAAARAAGAYVVGYGPADDAVDRSGAAERYERPIRLVARLRSLVLAAGG